MELKAVPMTTSLPVAKPRSSLAERVRAHRQRRRDGLRCVMLEIREPEIDALIRKGLLRAGMRRNEPDIRNALYQHLEHTLDA